jgi:hypothetical protein
MADNNLGNEWKTTVYNLGGAFFDLGKTIVHSVKKGVDIAYDYVNEQDDKRNSKRSSSAKKASDDVEKVDGIIIEE